MPIAAGNIYVINPPQPGLNFNDDGSWSFDSANGAYQLPEGEKQVITVQVEAVDAEFESLSLALPRA